MNNHNEVSTEYGVRHKRAEMEEMMNILEAEGIGKSYKNGEENRWILKNIDFSVGKGEFVAILGRSGSGKSTLLNILAGLDVPDEGKVLLCGQPFSKLPEDQRTSMRREKIGFVFQSYELMPSLNVSQNIQLPALREEPEYREELLKVLDIAGLEKRYPDQMSGGQQQRVAIARALVNHPVLILADEPTGNLDAAMEEIVVKLLKNLTREYKTSVLFVTHNEKLVKVADRVIRIQDGCVKEESL